MAVPARVPQEQPPARCPLAELPLELSTQEAVEAAYGAELTAVASSLRLGLSALIECTKDVTPYASAGIRERLAGAGLHCVCVDGRLLESTRPVIVVSGLAGAMTTQLRDVVRGSVERRVIVLPHLDLLTT